MRIAKGNGSDRDLGVSRVERWRRGRADGDRSVGRQVCVVYTWYIRYRMYQVYTTRRLSCGWMGRAWCGAGVDH
ncbi:hypothetical protein GCM10022223_16720 [Kineosporia mesophila]|uniref:Uncharacterized protein n=1 Tax=Kineosporia mesophila TaxID=566012 RepID=A0ABP6ZC64_9ACTN